jgi:N-acetylneuraminate synthase
MSRAVFVIAEAGVNHNGRIDFARRLIDVAAAAGADAVKFQSFRTELLVSRRAAQADYQKRNTGTEESQQEMLRRLELSFDDHEALAQYAAERGITFLSTPFDSESLEVLTGRFGMEIIKVSSGDVTNAPFLLTVARSARRVILSTGMCSLGEVEAALGVLAFGFVSAPGAVPGPGDFSAVYGSTEGQSALRERVTILHCTSEYPAPPAEINLRAIDTLERAFGLAVGYSDHSVGVHLAVAAVARGAVVIEKHFTLDRELPGPDHAASLEPDELTAMVRFIRETTAALGDGVKRATPSEARNSDSARKSLVAARPIASGSSIGADDLACKRPGGGRSPFDYWAMIGKPANRKYAIDEPIDE